MSNRMIASLYTATTSSDGEKQLANKRPPEYRRLHHRATTSCHGGGFEQI
ncbi:hypothetical protein Hdeb2414_s0024g00648281 [Helianthus debilis subsp. tardiflorus]